MGLGNSGQQGPSTIVGTTPISFIFNVEDLDNLTFQLTTTSTGAGAWTFQGDNRYSNDTEYNAAVNAGTWPALPASALSTIAAVAAASDQFVLTLVPYGGRAIRVTFTPTSGAGTVSVAMFGKGSQ